MLQFTLSQQPNTLPYTFAATGIRVYSFEELLYHAYHYWRESADDLCNDAMVAWVLDIGHTHQATRMKALCNTASFTARMVGFLQLAPYFDPTEIAAISDELKRWESRREWEQLKERGDHFLRRNDPAKAIPLYRRALAYEENVPLLNNLAVAHLRLNANAEALRLLQRARFMEPHNATLALHYAEAAIMHHQFDDAHQALHAIKEATPVKNKEIAASIAYLHGLMAFEQNDFADAIAFFQTARENDGNVPLYTLKMSDAYLRMRQYDPALATLTHLSTRNEDYYTQQAQIHMACGNIPQAVRAIKQALERNPSAALWTRLAACYRRDYDFARADESINCALTIDPHSETARLENARIKKAMGRPREYQTGMKELLRTLKTRYRENQP